MILEKPIIFFDLETTGIDIVKDRIVQIAFLKIMPDGTKEQKKTLVNPQMDIPAGATEIHGITNEMIVDAPTFSQIAKSLAEQLDGCDMAGYNSDNFDIPLLMEEFARVKVEYPKEGAEISFVDVLKVERKINSHKLTETYKRRTGKELDGAHDALNDVIATAEVLFDQLEEIGEEMTPAQIDEFCQGDKKRHDYAGKLYEADGVVFWNFGKHEGKPVIDQPQYADWVIRSDFPIDTKNKLKKILSDE